MKKAVKIRKASYIREDEENYKAFFEEEKPSKTFQIDSGILIPRKIRKNSYAYQHLLKMKEGDSIGSLTQAEITCFTSTCKNAGGDYITRVDGENKFRFWLVKAIRVINNTPTEEQL